jgi:hypothetical protein
MPRFVYQAMQHSGPSSLELTTAEGGQINPRSLSSKMSRTTHK